MHNTSNVIKTSTTPDPTKSDEPFIIRSRAQVRALTSPARQEIVDALVSGGPCSIAELATHTGRAPDSLYFHVRRLIKVGLIVEREARTTGKRPAAVYDVPGRPLYLSYATMMGWPELTGVVGSALRLAGRDFGRAMKLGVAVVEGPRRNIWGGRAKGWVGNEEIEEMNRLIARLFEIVHSGRPGEGRTAQSFTMVLAPVRASRRAPRPRTASEGVPRARVIERNGES